MHAGTVRALNLHPLKYNLGDPAGRITLVAGDTLLVPENRQKVAVLGEVRAPAVYLIPDGEDLPITQALAEAGGPTADGDKKQVGILRLGADKKRHLVAVNMDALFKGDSTVADAGLQPGDILVVPTRRRKQGLGDYISQVPGLFYISRLLSGSRLARLPDKEVYRCRRQKLPAVWAFLWNGGKSLRLLRVGLWHNACAMPLSRPTSPF